MGGLGYTGQNSSSIGVDLATSAGGGIGAQNFTLGSLGIGAKPLPVWIYALGLIVVGVVAYKVLGK